MAAESGNQPVRPGAPSALAQAARALERIRQGRADEGVALYATAVEGVWHLRKVFPAGLHVHLLREGGWGEAADRIERLALRGGIDVSLAAAMKQDRLSLLEDYRRHIARCRANTAMIERYLELLAEEGDAAALEPFLDPSRWIRRSRILPDTDRVLPELASFLAAEQDPAHWKASLQSVRNLYVIKGLHKRREPVLVRTIAHIRRAVDAYIAERAALLTDVLGWMPASYSLKAWAQISRAEGINLPHTHPTGRITGVFYVEGPDARGDDGMPSGALQIGAPKGCAMPEAWPRISVPPAPGSIVLMPSYFTHWTVPLIRPGLRIAIAFDVLDQECAA